jgi:hypothetical protein
MQSSEGVSIDSVPDPVVHVSASPPSPGEDSADKSAFNEPASVRNCSVSSVPIPDGPSGVPIPAPPDPPSCGHADIPVGTLTLRSQTPVPSRQSTPAPSALVCTPQNSPYVATPHTATPQGTNETHQEPSNRTLTVDSTSNMAGQMPHKQGPRDEVTMDEEDTSKRDSKRRRMIQESIETEDFSITEKSACFATTTQTRHKKVAASGTPLSMPPSTSSRADSWFSIYQQMFLEKYLGKEWKTLVSTWVTFEEHARDAGLEVRRLPARGRPMAVGDWISQGRNMTWRPDISNFKLKNYKHEFNGWWELLQPAGRTHASKDDVDSTLTQGDWDCLRAPGVNGVMSVVAGLFFWGLVAEGKVAHHKAWLAALQDCQHVFSIL